MLALVLWILKSERVLVLVLRFLTMVWWLPVLIWVLELVFHMANPCARVGVWKKATNIIFSLLIPTCKPLSLNLGDVLLAEIEGHTRALSKDSIICCFKVICPTLSEIHAWILNHWDPYVMTSLEIFLLVKGFFIVSFDDPKDRKAIFYDEFFTWENRFPLMVKPWHPDFNLLTKSFHKITTRVRLPNLPLHYWVDFVIKEIGEALMNSCLVDFQYFECFHSTCARILVDIDVSKGLLAKIIF